MNLPPRHRPIGEPPIVLQILVLLLGGLVVSQLVTLLLTLVLPPAPPAQHSLDDVVATLRGEATDARLVRSVQAAPPAVDGPGWFTSPQSQHTLATMLGAQDDDVRLAFYAPLPFAGITAPPGQPPLPIRQIVWTAAPEPLRGTPARLILASLLLIDPPGGAGNGFPGGGTTGGPFVRGGFPRDSAGRGERGGFQGRGDDAGQRGAHGLGTGFPSAQATRGAPSPSDLARQPMARPDTGGSDHSEAASGPAARQVFDRGYRDDRPAATEGFDPRMFQAAPAASAAVPAAPDPVRPEDETARPAERRAAPVSTPAVTVAPPAVAPRPLPRAAPRPIIAAPAPARRTEPRPLPIAPQGRALFGLAPAPFVEGDFVAASRGRDGRWTIVQPMPEGFPNAWQRRVMLWFAIAFALVAPIGWLFARHIVRPLARFTDAAERLGRDPSAALVALEGPAEIGRAAHAFNVMQNRLRSFVDDRTAMVGAISHDLRTPLTRMRFRIEEVDDAALREGMSGEVTEMEAMITSVLAFIRDASTPNVRERLDLGLLMRDVAQDATLIGSDVTVEASTSAPVEVDVLGMRRLLANLIENAVKYGKRARIRLAIEHDAAIAEIVDDGPGVPEDELERAFEPFYRASNAERSGKSGTGLGLAVCRSIARAHGGDVTLVNAADGFRAQLRLPLVYGAERVAA